MKQVSIIIPLFNQTALLNQTLLCLEQQTWKDFEILIVDNASDSPLSIPETCKKLDLKYLYLKKNHYYAQAVNLGISLTGTNRILILNSDVHLNKDYLHELLEVFNRDATIQCAHGLLLDTKGNVDSCGIRTGLCLQPVDVKHIDRPWEGPPGASFMISRDLCENLIERYGSVLDSDISFYYSDLAFACRLNEQGMKSLLVKNASGIHHRSSSVLMKKTPLLLFTYPKLSPEFKKLLMENRRSFKKKYFRFSKHSWRIPFIVLYDLMTICLKKTG
ncbi:MAG: glycosyltransferase [Candidatus Aureabacteria bacterium]|nr:glycosyltransferase [Candidatus Auribacterota bacterium]